ncbi:hypothetical protein AG0111_0g9389 [Alternaria gaisen]|uniref:Uncharacterized protein n=1 Tax=Alternaria gaisen TaxID=167740 RepID=A0ACB6FE47_9PLEO|nr:hypothetical protein AG0111_0g9389 [Alternaria gaisen]
MKKALLMPPEPTKGSNVTTSTEPDARHTIFARRRHRIGSYSGCHRLNTLPTTSTNCPTSTQTIRHSSKTYMRSTSQRYPTIPPAVMDVANRPVRYQNLLTTPLKPP